MISFKKQKNQQLANQNPSDQTLVKVEVLVNEVVAKTLQLSEEQSNPPAFGLAFETNMSGVNLGSQTKEQVMEIYMNTSWDYLS